MSWATMNGINQTRSALGRNSSATAGAGMQSTQPAPVQGMMGTSPNVPSAAIGAGATPTNSVNSAGGMEPRARPNVNQGVAPPPLARTMPQMPVPQGPAFDPNDPRNAALAGYMNRG